MLACLCILQCAFVFALGETLMSYHMRYFRRVDKTQQL